MVMSFSKEGREHPSPIANLRNTLDRIIKKNGGKGRPSFPFGVEGLFSRALAVSFREDNYHHLKMFFDLLKVVFVSVCSFLPWDEN